MIPPITIHDVFDELTLHCVELKGAAVATPEGLVLAATGAFEGDVPAACAAGIAANMDSHLSFVTPTRFSESLTWSDAGIWYLSRLQQGHLLLVWSSPEEPVGRLRIAAQRAVQQLLPMLSSMEQPS
ncbi:hypothetical protein [Ralstonia pseudosolanacearum]|uniref:hypothetical protein n=1 Tax=Ralstonia pseudosolanacearum TaxID=1310165 RepID=UPI0008DB109A|nr:hypothetical protein [Ralstonia pseudosolanacearum]MCL1622592.1 hypothetical protein [Ralstonia pseudosolanacearum CaRs-Mep]